MKKLQFLIESIFDLLIVGTIIYLFTTHNTKYLYISLIIFLIYKTFLFILKKSKYWISYKLTNNRFISAITTAFNFFCLYSYNNTGKIIFIYVLIFSAFIVSFQEKRFIFNSILNYERNQDNKIRWQEPDQNNIGSKLNIIEYNFEKLQVIFYSSLSSNFPILLRFFQA